MLGTQAAAASNNSAQQATEPNAMQASEVVEDAHEESQDPRLAWLVNLATEMGYSLQKTSIYNSELSQAITSKLINRLGGSVYQAAAFSLPTFPRSCAEKLLPPSLITEQTANVVTWKATTILELRSLLATLFTHDDPNSFGLSSKVMEKYAIYCIHTYGSHLETIYCPYLRASKPSYSILFCIPPPIPTWVCPHMYVYVAPNPREPCGQISPQHNLL